MPFDRRESARPYSPRPGDTLRAIAARETDAGNPLTWEELARYNWGTSDPDEVETHMRDELGCRERDAENRYVVSEGDEPRAGLVIPERFRREGLSIESTHVVRVRRETPSKQFLGCCSFPAVTFGFDSSFIRPSVARHLRKLEGLASKHATARIMVFGHTDAVGDPLYNKRLSERRAWSAYAFVVNDVEAWEVLYNHGDEDWGLEVVQEILADLGFDPGPPDGDWGPLTRGAMCAFLGLAADAPVQNDAAFRRELFSSYMSGKRDVDLPKERFLDPGYMGCGEFNLKDDTQEASEVNRRVTFFLFDESRVPTLPCGFANVAPCQRQCVSVDRRHRASFRCSFYDSLAKNCGEESGVVPVDPGIEAIEITRVDSTFFVPETETLEIEYAIEGDVAEIDEVRLVVTTKHQPDQPLSSEALPGPHENEGNTFSWDGHIFSTDEAFDGFINLRCSPYRIHLELLTTGGETLVSSEKTVEVQLDGLHLAIDTLEDLGLPAHHRPPLEQLKKELEEGNGRGRLAVDTPIFKENSFEMESSASFIEYRKFFRETVGDENGIAFPVFASLFFRAKDGGRKRSTRATHGTRVLWDVSLPADAELEKELLERGVHEEAREFLEKVTAHRQDETDPQGRNSTVGFGGVRTESAARTPAMAYWFEVPARSWSRSTPSKRTWGAYTRCQTEPGLAADTGIFFRGGRIAGDIHRIRAFVDLDGSLDTTNDAKLSALPPTLRSNILRIVNWRRVPVVDHIIIGADTTPIELEGVVKEYVKAATDLAADGLVPEDRGEDYQRFYRDEVHQNRKEKGVFNFIKQAALDHNPGGHPSSFMEFKDYKKKMKAIFKKENIERQARRFFGVRSRKAYAERCDEAAEMLLAAVVKRLPPLKENGLTFYKFGANGWYNLEAELNQGFITGGFAPSFANFADRHKTAFFVFRKDEGADTVIHEVGHQLFLAHAPGKGVLKFRKPGGAQPDAHDVKDRCEMSYLRKTNGLCGHCLLKLAGWQSLRIDRKGQID